MATATPTEPGLRNKIETIKKVDSLNILNNPNRTLDDLLKLANDKDPMISSDAIREVQNINQLLSAISSSIRDIQHISNTSQTILDLVKDSMVRQLRGIQSPEDKTKLRLAVIEKISIGSDTALEDLTYGTGKDGMFSKNKIYAFDDVISAKDMNYVMNHISNMVGYSQLNKNPFQVQVDLENAGTPLTIRNIVTEVLGKVSTGMLESLYNAKLDARYPNGRDKISNSTNALSNIKDMLSNFTQSMIPNGMKGALSDPQYQEAAKFCLESYKHILLLVGSNSIIPINQQVNSKGALQVGPGYGNANRLDMLRRVGGTAAIGAAGAGAFAMGGVAGVIGLGAGVATAGAFTYGIARKMYLDEVQNRFNEDEKTHSPKFKKLLQELQVLDPTISSDTFKFLKPKFLKPKVAKLIGISQKDLAKPQKFYQIETKPNAIMDPTVFPKMKFKNIYIEESLLKDGNVNLATLYSDIWASETGTKEVDVVNKPSFWQSAGNLINPLEKRNKAKYEVKYDDDSHSVVISYKRS